MHITVCIFIIAYLSRNLCLPKAKGSSALSLRLFPSFSVIWNGCVSFSVYHSGTRALVAMTSKNRLISIAGNVHDCVAFKLDTTHGEK